MSMEQCCIAQIRSSQTIWVQITMPQNQLNSNHHCSKNLNSNHNGSKSIQLKSPSLKQFEPKSLWLKINWTQITKAQNQLNSNHHGSTKLSPNYNGSINLSSNHRSLKPVELKSPWLMPSWAQKWFQLKNQFSLAQLSLAQSSAQTGLAQTGLAQTGSA